MNKLNHLAFIMDGNGRWATKKGLKRIDGHLKGLQAMKKIINHCLKLKIPSISFFAFSTENWNRPKLEVKFLINLLQEEINSSKLIKWLMDNNVRFIWNGFSNNLDNNLVNKILNIVELTKNNANMNLQIMFNYGSRQKIIESINKLIDKKILINSENLLNELDPYKLGSVDLLIRTSGEQRISNFMLYEISYSEFIFNKKYWPSYTTKDLDKDVDLFYNRNRRFGKI